MTTTDPATEGAPAAAHRGRRDESENDVREGGAWTRAQAIKNAMLYALARAAIAIASALPARVVRALGRGLGLFAYAVLARPRRIAFANLARVFPERAPEDRRAIARRAYVTLGGHLGDTVALLRGDRSRLVVAEAAVRTLQDARAEGNGVVFASAHLGPWEAVAAALVAHGVPLTTLARESYDPRMTRLYDRLRGAHAVRVIYRARPGAAARILRALRDGEVLGAPMDLRSRVASIDVPFLGHPAPTAVGPARIALRTGAAVVVGTAAPGAGAAICVTATRIATADLTRDDAGERELTTRINAEISQRILALPDAWVWMHERWPQARSRVRA